jgi:hypothetical protein
MGYFVHFWHAFRLGLILIYAGIVSLIHAVVPCLFPAYSAKKVIWIYIQVVLDSANPDIQIYLQEQLRLKETR